MDRGLQSRGFHARPVGRAHARSRFRRVRLCARRLDQHPADTAAQGQASPRDNVVFEAGLFGGALGMRRTFILHAKGAKLPTDLLGMTAVRYPEALTAADYADGEPEAPEGDRRRRSTEPARGRLVAALAHVAERAGAVGDQPASDLARSGGRPRGRGPSVAGGRHALLTVLERRRKGAPRSAQRLLLLQRRATAASERPSARGHRRDPPGGHRSSLGLLDHPVRRRPSASRADVRCLPARRSSRHGNPGRRGPASTYQLLALRFREWGTISNAATGMNSTGTVRSARNARAAARDSKMGRSCRDLLTALMDDPPRLRRCMDPTAL